MKKWLYIVLLIPSWLFAQVNKEQIQTYLKEQIKVLKLDAADISQWEITGKTTSKTTGITTVYIQQYHQNLPVFNAISSVWIKNNTVISIKSRFVARCSSIANSATPKITAGDGLQLAQSKLNPDTKEVSILLKNLGNQTYLFSNTPKADPIKAQLVYFLTPTNNLKLAWDYYIDVPKDNHMWSIRIDALTGEILDQKDFMVACNFEPVHHSNSSSTIDFTNQVFHSKTLQTPTLSGTYRVVPFTTESPNHGPFQLITQPAHPEASPYGWHDVDGIPGAEYTITRGNNVHAFEDMDDDDDPFTGMSPDGGSALIFDFPYLGTNTPAIEYQEAATTNLFYMNNILHDVFYHYGFDEENGNFQELNYSNLGEGNDHVLAQSQDGGGLNNANFGTPPDGFNGRMQMYLWNRKGGSQLLSVNAPSPIAGSYLAFDNLLVEGRVPLPQAPDSMTADLVAVNDGSADPVTGCNILLNAAEINGKIALVKRGICPVTDKILNCQNAGAIAVIVFNSTPGNFVVGGLGDPEIGIPVISVKKDVGDLLFNTLQNTTLAVTLSETPSDFVNVDGDFDNLVIAHEYGHGISNRLTGGPSVSTCLFNDEQMGEGWSDWFGLMLQIKPNDTGTERRGIGTFVINDPINGDGIRTYPYSTDMTVNPFTFANTNTLARPHGVGSVWATMLWDLTWAYINKYGFDPNTYTGTGGNNKVMQLVVDALKLQPCSPGFIDGRDALLAADQATTGGANYCLIWEVFARRGLGVNASSGDTDSAVDQIEDFTQPLPGPNCTALETPIFGSSVAYRIYPNPATNEVFVELPNNSSALEVRLIDIHGRIIYQDQWSNGTLNRIPMGNLQSGMYILQATGERIQITEKIIKN